MAKIFISYRRLDSAAIAGRIVDRLQAHFGQDAVFIDIDNIPYGVDFRDHLRGSMVQCDVVLALIGERWLETEPHAERRIDDPADLVRIEIEMALHRSIPVIPVTIGQTPMPNSVQLPEPLRALAFRNAAAVDIGRDFNIHVARLIGAIEETIERRRQPKPTPDGASPAAASRLSVAPMQNEPLSLRHYLLLFWPRSGWGWLVRIAFYFLALMAGIGAVFVVGGRDNSAASISAWFALICHPQNCQPYSVIRSLIQAPK